MSLARFTWEQRCHTATGLSPLVTLSGEATGYIGDITGVFKQQVVKWSRELNHKYYSNTHTLPGTGASLTGGK